MIVLAFILLVAVRLGGCVRMGMYSECSVCGKRLWDAETETMVSGMSITLGSYDDWERTKFFQKQLGKYAIGKTYKICYECVLKTYGAKP